MIDDFSILIAVFILGTVFGLVIGATFCSASRLEAGAPDPSEHGNYPL